MAKVDLCSPHTPEECVDRLRAGLLNRSSEVDGRVEHDWIRLKKKIFYRNSFQTFLRAKLSPHGTGTRIRGSLGPHPLVNGFVGVWFTFLCLGGLLAVLTGNYHNLWVFPLLVLAAVGGVWLGRLFSRGQDRLLIEFVTSAVNAEPVAVK